MEEQKQRYKEILAKYKDTKFYKMIENICLFISRYDDKENILHLQHLYHLKTIITMSINIIVKYECDKDINNIDDDFDSYIKVVTSEVDKITNHYK